MITTNRQLRFTKVYIPDKCSFLNAQIALTTRVIDNGRQVFKDLREFGHVRILPKLRNHIYFIQVLA